MMSKKHIKIVFFADTHLGFDYPVRPKTLRRRRGPDFFENYRTVLDHAARDKADLVIHGGDLFFRKRVSKKIVNLAYEHLLDFANQGIPFFIVPGNHERSELPVSLCLSHPNIHVFDSARAYRLNLEGTTVALAGFPFERHVRLRFRSLVARTGWYEIESSIKLLCLHQAVAGAQVGPQNYTFRYGQDVIRREEIPGDATAVLCGHIHRQQVLTANTNSRVIPVIYPGSIERTSFAERSEAKGFYKLLIMQSQEGGWQVAQKTFIQLPARPMAELVFDHSLSDDNLKAQIRSRVARLDKNAIVRLRLGAGLDSGVKRRLTSGFLREVLPGSMNFQFSSDFYDFKANRSNGRG